MEQPIEAKRTGGVLRISLNCPARKNAINEQMVDTLADLFEQAALDDDLRVIVIRGEGADFSAGGDIKDIAPVLVQTPDQRAAHFQDVVRRDSMRLFLAMDRLPQPVLVAARGHAIGAAMQMVCVADLVVASETARFCIPQVHLAHTVDHGESWHLPRKIGYARAIQLCLLGERLDAATALGFGLVNWVVPDAELDARAEVIASRIAASPPVAVRGMKALLRASAYSETFAEQFEQENVMIGKAVSTRDFVEAIKAFIEKRAPVFESE
jgi:2-(1,2-epoxy-1,2-dihydrophenyl)acetyl-CoA isomerase